MSYVKTQWVNNTTPINDTNLNKIEQGIYDNSLVVDAVTNTLNPTDTETYKTAELTEGQITDVIGVNDIVIKGQTSQDGTPTPSAPVDVNVVSGSNVIETSNKNLFIPTLKVDGTSIFVNNATVSLIKDEYTFIASGSDMYFGQVANTGTTYLNTNGMKIYKNENTKLSFLVTNTTFNRAHITAYNSQGVSLGYTAFTGISGTYTFPENCEFVTIRIGKNTAVSGTTYKTKVMVVYGDTIPTTYEPHQGKELPLDLPVENLLNLLDGTYSHNGVTAIITNGIITLNGTASGTSAIDIPINLTIKANQAYTLEANNSSVIGQGGTGGTYSCIRFRTSTSDDSNTDVRFNPINNYTTLQKTGETTYAYLRIRTGDGLTYNNFIIKPQLEQGSKANAYTHYSTTLVELCKIGNYQDYFYKSGSKWYLHKEIGKITLNGSESGGWNLRETNTNTIRLTADGLVSPGILAYSQVYSKIFKGYSSNADISNIDIPSIAPRDTGSGFTVRFPVSIATTVDGFKTWLSSNLPFVYYATSNVTNTEITDTTLISQLEAIYNAPLYEQTNITQENNDLPMVLDITACKDNINGIKAFIRK